MATTEAKDYFRMGKVELRTLADSGDKGAQGEIERRAAKNAAKREAAKTTTE